MAMAQSPHPIIDHQHELGGYLQVHEEIMTRFLVMAGVFILHDLTTTSNSDTNSGSKLFVLLSQSERIIGANHSSISRLNSKTINFRLQSWSPLAIAPLSLSLGHLWHASHSSTTNLRASTVATLHPGECSTSMEKTQLITTISHISTQLWKMWKEGKDTLWIWHFVLLDEQM